MDGWLEQWLIKREQLDRMVGAYKNHEMDNGVDRLCTGTDSKQDS